LAVGDAVYAAGADGAIRCFGLADGALRWTHHTGSRILATPAYTDGRLYVGGGDGTVRALDAGDGTLAWRFRLAHGERRIMVFGHLLSSWAVTSDLAVEGGVLYAAACVQNMDGTVVVALDAANGALRWANSTCGILDPSSRHGLNTVGAMTSAQGRLWVRGNAFDLTDGKLTPFGRQPVHMMHIESLNQILSRVTGVMGDKLLWGGRRFWSEQRSSEWSDCKQYAFAAQLTKNGLANEDQKPYPWLRIWNEDKDSGCWGMPLMPSWNERLVLATGRFPCHRPKVWDPRSYRELIAYDRPAFQAALGSPEVSIMAKEKPASGRPLETVLAARTPAERWRGDGPDHVGSACGQRSSDRGEVLHAARLRPRLRR
jgi:hypothetical protein